MWVFSEEGLKIFDVDGKEVLKTVGVEDLGCGGGEIHGQVFPGCNYYDVATDGREFVWANALHANPNRVDVFSIDDGSYLGGVATCSTPLDMDVLSNREELWIRCAGTGDVNDPNSGHLSVIPINSMSASVEDVHLNDQRTYGFSVFHSTLGNYGYATGNNVNDLWKIDLANRMVVSNFTIDQAHSSYEITYSPQNKHLYIRSRVCCSCGFDGADSESCGRFGPGQIGVNIQTGPFTDRTDVMGTCGVTCEGTPADTLGLLEFDTVSEKFLGSHNPKIGNGATAEASPDGKFIVMFANDGGQNIRVLRAGENGSMSTVAFDVEVNFSNVPPGREAISDFAFVNWKGHNLLVLASGYDNDVAIIDMSTSPPTLTKIPLANNGTPTNGSTEERMVEWASGSEYVWIDGKAADNIYVLKLSDDGIAAHSFVQTTISETASHKLLYVENYALAAQKAMIAKEFAAFTADTENEDEEKDEIIPDKNDSTEDTSNQVQETSVMAGELDEDDVSPIAIAGLVLGAFSFLMNSVLLVLFFVTRAPKNLAQGPVVVDADNTKGGGSSDSSESDELDEEVSIGSKRIA